jgi:hypothetical protein
MLVVLAVFLSTLQLFPFASAGGQDASQNGWTWSSVPDPLPMGRAKPEIPGFVSKPGNPKLVFLLLSYDPADRTRCAPTRIDRVCVTPIIYLHPQNGTTSKISY